jgi:hypothetical protein
MDLNFDVLFVSRWPIKRLLFNSIFYTFEWIFLNKPSSSGTRGATTLSITTLSLMNVSITIVKLNIMTVVVKNSA